MTNFITANEVNRRLSGEHAALRDKAVEEINKIIRQAKTLPIPIPKSLFTDIPAVKWELLRKLREEAGWEVASEYECSDGDEFHSDDTQFALFYPPARREEERSKTK